jgi:hypothetical protein
MAPRAAAAAASAAISAQYQVPHSADGALATPAVPAAPLKDITTTGNAARPRDNDGGADANADPAAPPAKKPRAKAAPKAKAPKAPAVPKTPKTPKPKAPAKTKAKGKAAQEQAAKEQTPDPPMFGVVAATLAAKAGGAAPDAQGSGLRGELNAARGALG